MGKTLSSVRACRQAHFRAYCPHMQKLLEIERRFLVHKCQKDYIIDRASKCIDIQQGYLSPTTRVRIERELIKDEESLNITVRSTVTVKGEGTLQREERTYSIDEQLAVVLLTAAEHTLFKSRHVLDGWEVDIMDEHLHGVILAEKELESVDEDCPLPTWIQEATEVTESLSNYDLALAGTKMRSSTLGYVRALADEEKSDIPVIVLTGAPCSGKSTIINELRKERPEFHCVSESATVLIKDVGVTPGQIGLEAFQIAVMDMQRLFEDSAIRQARLLGKSAVILDRSFLDGGAFVGGIKALKDLVGVERVEKEFERYDAVVHIGLPPREVYERHKTDNPARRETYEQSEALDRRLQQVWRHAPYTPYFVNGGVRDDGSTVTEAEEPLEWRKKKLEAFDCIQRAVYNAMKKQIQDGLQRHLAE